MPSSPVLNVHVFTREGKPVKGAYVLVWRIIPAGALKPLPGEWRTSASGEVRASLPLPSKLLTVARENETTLRFLVLAWHPQAGWAWSVSELDALQRLKLTLTSAGQGIITVQNCFGEPAGGLTGRLVQLRLPEVGTPVPLPRIPEAIQQTDASGRLRVLLPQGASAYWAWGGELPYGMRERFPAPVALIAGRELRARYHLSTRLVHGRLVDARTHQPLRGETVVLHTEPGKWFKMLPCDYVTFTDAQGWFQVYLPPEYGSPVVATRCCFSTGDTLPASLISPDERPPIQAPCERWELGEIALTAPNAFLTGEVKGENGKPAPYALVVAQGKQPSAQAGIAEVAGIVTTCRGLRRTVRLRTSPGTALVCTFADAKGQFRLPLREGQWQLRAHPIRSGTRPDTSSQGLSMVPPVTTETRWTALSLRAGQTAHVQLVVSAREQARVMQS